MSAAYAKQAASGSVFKTDISFFSRNEDLPLGCPASGKERYQRSEVEATE
jgi:hypothetical protein